MSKLSATQLAEQYVFAGDKEAALATHVVDGAAELVKPHPLEEAVRSEPSDVELDKEFDVPEVLKAGNFHGAKEARYELQTERPWHRLILHLAARAKYTPKELAAVVGCSVATVRNLFRQRWFQEKYDALVSNRADSLYEKTLAGQDIESLVTLITVRDHKDTSPAVKVACAKDILDRIHGKSVQKVESVVHTIGSTEDIDAMKRELAEIEAQEQELLGATASKGKLNLAA